MILAFLLLLTGLVISGVAIYYSVIGLAAIFAAATIPIYIMGASLEVAKLVCASWLKANWDRAPGLMKAYMTTAVIVLMIITSMGIFGFLSKAHSDQSLVSGDVIERVAILDEKIKTQKENIDVARKALSQLDSAVDQTMARSNDERGADKAAALRRAQQRERAQLQKDISTAQDNIRKLNDERAPIAKDLRKVEAEVGPIKYIAALIYGDNPDANLLERAVTWVIIMIVVVFDPLAVIMLLAAQMSFGWLREQREQEQYPTIADLDREVGEPPSPEEKADLDENWPFPSYEEITPTEGDSPEKESDIVSTATVTESVIHHPDTHPYLRQGFKYPENYEHVGPIVAPKEETKPSISVTEEVEFVPAPTADSTEVKVNEPTFQILPELEEESKKKRYILKQGNQQISKDL